MKIGFVSTWLERGAAYVTKNYINLLKDDNELFVFARGGEYFDELLDEKNAEVTRGYRLEGTKINWKQLKKWITINSLDMIIFNEQNSMDCVYKIRKKFPNILLGCYIDYYTEESMPSFSLYHFLLCNTKRHYNAFKWHKGAFYLPWGCDTNLFNANIKSNDKTNDQIVFFHSMGMSNRKGTMSLINVFIKGGYSKKNAKLIIHTQLDISHLITADQAHKYNIEIINKIVSHPGLYYLGDVYVYPTTLDGLGLTIYEALASGLPVITTNEAPMNEIIQPKNSNGRLVNVSERHCRSDGYYWPLCFVDEKSLMDCMDYYCEHRSDLKQFKQNARSFAINHLDLSIVKSNLNDILDKIINNKEIFLSDNINFKKPQDILLKNSIRIIINRLLPDIIADKIRSRKEYNRFKYEKKNFNK